MLCVPTSPKLVFHMVVDSVWVAGCCALCWFEPKKIWFGPVTELVGRWSTLTREQEEAESTIPVLVLTSEAVDLAQLLDDYFAPRSSDDEELPGLESVVATGQLLPALAGELREIALALGSVQRGYETLLKKADNAPIERADRLMQELRATLSFILEDGQHEEGALKLAKLRELYLDEQSHDGVAMMLEAYADLATTVEEELTKIDGFDVAMLDECMQIGADLRQRSAKWRCRSSGRSAVVAIAWWARSMSDCAPVVVAFASSFVTTPTWRQKPAAATSAIVVAIVATARSNKSPPPRPSPSAVSKQRRCRQGLLSNLSLFV